MGRLGVLAALGAMLVSGSCGGAGTMKPQPADTGSEASPDAGDLTTGDGTEGVPCKAGKPCSDNDPCTSDDQCKGGTCSGTPIACDDGLECTFDFCNDSGECDAKLKPGRCMIDGECYDEGVGEPGNLCRECISSVDKSGWSADDSNECDDQDACTLGDKCSDGKCVEGKESLECGDDNPCTTDSCSPAIGCTFEPNSAPCNDGDSCTKSDKCENGICAGKPVDCTDGNPCTGDACDQDEGCVHPAVEGGCDDGNVCTDGDKCVQGSCAPGELIVACDDGNPCTSDKCHPTKGCTFENNADPCDDGNACTTGDVCSGGSCKPGTGMLDCNDSNACTADSCSPASGCVHAALAAPCSDDNVCTVGDTCNGGLCVPGALAITCDDGNICTTDVCDAKSGCTSIFNAAPCDDGNNCTVSDACAGGSCGGAIRDCNDNNACTTDSCNPFLQGGCVHTPNAFPCDDGDPCTLADSCGGGKCQAGAVGVSCDDKNPCTADLCQTGIGCKHANIVGLCDDANPCTEGDWCSAGKCMPGGNACVCIADADCKGYDDGDLCNGVLHCDKTSPKPADWTCVYKPGSVVQCDTSQDGSCLLTKCAPYSGLCIKTPVNEGGACNDGSQCTAGDHCASGTCVSTSTVFCDDSNACTTDSCAPQYGCLYKPVPDGQSCGGNWKCQAGQCVPCTPACTGKTCGDDGCGGSCGSCPLGQTCQGGTCKSPSDACGGITWEGCCDGQTLKYCENNTLKVFDCSGNPYCGWESAAGFYDCGTSGTVDPSGQHPKSCPGGCTPNCTGKECGPDGCGGSCGFCQPDETCMAGTCMPNSGLEQCLGVAQPSYSYCGGITFVGCCDAKGRVLWCEGGALYCIDCAAGSPSCGWDAADAFYDCGTSGSADPSGLNPKSCTACIPACWPGYTCVSGQCMQCIPSCAGKTCGDDGCGGLCGSCQAGYQCVSGKCQVISQCGNVGAQGKCVGSVVQWCQNGQLLTYDCALDGQVCQWLATYGKYGCASVSCGGIGAEGKCEGTVLKTCTTLGLLSVDCADEGKTCGWDPALAKYSCIGSCGSVTYLGECDGDTLYYCSGGVDLVEVDCAAFGKTCGFVSEAVGYDCIASCGDVTEYGECKGDVLVYCDPFGPGGPVVVEEDCAVLGLQCGLKDPVTGYGCIQGGPVGAHKVYGQVTFDKATPTVNGLGAIVKTTAKQIHLSVMDTKGTAGNKADDVLLASGSTDMNGNYSISFNGGVTQAYAVAYAWFDDGESSHDVRIPDGGYYGSWSTFSVASSSFTPAQSVSLPIHVTKAAYSGAFNITETLRLGRVFAGANIGQPPDLPVHWDYKDTSCWYMGYYDPWEMYIYLASCPEDTEEFDDSVILHEFGHHVTNTLSQDDNPGGAHWFTWPNDPNLAWSEGFATFFGQTVIGSSIYIDTQVWDASSIDIEKASADCPAASYLGLTQDICEALVCGVLWDISDQASDANDSLSMGPDEIHDVVGNYFTGPSFKDRGEPGVDFVEFLDGWFCLGHEKYSDLYNLVVTGTKFPYDFAGPCNKPVSPVRPTMAAAEIAPGLYQLTISVHSVIDAKGVMLGLHLPATVSAVHLDAEAPFSLASGETRDFTALVSAHEQGALVGVTAVYEPRPLVRYVGSGHVYLGAPKQVQERETWRGVRPDGKPAIVHALDP